MPRRYRKKPLAQLEHGTRIYAPSPREARYRVAATDPVSGERIFVKCRTEDAARAKARELEQFIALSAPVRDPHDAGPRSVERLAGRYVEDHLSGLSLRFREKQTYLLGRWVLPRIGARTVSAIGLGGMPMSVEGRPERERAIATVHAALEAGVTLIETADAYHLGGPDDLGHNESLIAEALRSYGADADAVLVATKGGLQRLEPGPGPWTRNGHPDYLKQAARASGVFGG